MQKKLHANKCYMPTELLKMAYLQSCVADNALAQFSTRLRDNATKPFTTASEIIEVLIAAFGNALHKQEACMEYRSLCQGTQDFSTFWAEFQRLSQELDYLEATLIDDLIEKCHHLIQYKLATGKKNPTNLLELAKCCQRIEFGIKSVERNKALYGKKLARKYKGPVNANMVITISLGSNAAPAPANLIPMPRMA